MGSIRKRLAVGALFSALFFVQTSAKAAPISIINFQISGIGVMAGGSNSFFVHGAWTPSINLGIIGVRGELGVTSIQFGAGPRFMATNYEALLQLTLAPTLGLEAGGGMHIWHEQANAALAITGNLVFTGVPSFDRLFIGYTRYTGGTGADEIRAGFGFGI